MSDELVELQTQLAFQDQTINQLNEALVSQQKQLDLLRLELKRLQDQLGELEERLESGPPVDEKPPHY